MRVIISHACPHNRREKTSRQGFLCNYFPRLVLYWDDTEQFIPMQTSPTPTPTPTPTPALVLALRRVLRPLVKLMLARGVTYPYLCDLLKALFVEVADKDFRIGPKPPTDSRVSLVSGVHRKEVNRLRQEMAADTETVSSVVSLGAQLVAVWLGSSRYLDETIAPNRWRVLSAKAGTCPSRRWWPA